MCGWSGTSVVINRPDRNRFPSRNCKRIALTPFASSSILPLSYDHSSPISSFFPIPHPLFQFVPFSFNALFCWWLYLNKFPAFNSINFLYLSDRTSRRHYNSILRKYPCCSAKPANGEDIRKIRKSLNGNESRLIPLISRWNKTKTVLNTNLIFSQFTYLPFPICFTQLIALSCVFNLKCQFKRFGEKKIVRPPVKLALNNF